MRFAIRPEKIRILDESDAREPGARVEGGHVRDVVYVGVLTRYRVVELDDGGTLAWSARTWSARRRRRSRSSAAVLLGGGRAHDPDRQGGER